MNVGKHTEENDSNGHPVIVPSWGVCFKSIGFQQQLLSQDQAGIRRKMAIWSFNGIVSSSEGVVNTGIPIYT
ncbi:9746_t:CDS:2 [Dentiscutata erythropus]|uniref:9746_t:CDS:1 n=1 Tax=Dentiscutata erythropus TaxID=1348616 RepID=A0A9N9AFZ4_9GLOM|nr:9746_t:CDS:2 [Dentiscutata erythropus]